MKETTRFVKSAAVLAVSALSTVVAHAAEDLPVTDGLSLHYDASVASSILCNDSGAVTNWTPITGKAPLVDANTAAPEATYPKAPVKVVTEGGRTGLQLSHYDEGGNGVYTFMCFSPYGTFASVKTLFVVSRQIDVKYGGSIVGHFPEDDYRINRSTTSAMTWYPNGWTTGGKYWINGQEKGQGTQYSDKICFADYGGTTTPHLLTTRTSSTRYPRMLGAAGVALHQGRPDDYDKCVVHEVVYYSRELTDEEVVQVSRHLITKWGLVNPFPVTWTGNGQTSNWSDPGNWDAGTVPAAVTEVRVPDGATITLDSAEITAASIVPATEGPVTLTLKAPAEISANLTAAIDSGVNVAFAGPGTLVCNDSIAARAPITLKGGTIVPVAFSAAKYGKVSVHLDASAAGSIVANEAGEVQAWNSIDGGINFKSPLDGAVLDIGSYTYKAPKNRPIVATSASGKPAVRFGSNANGEFMPSFLKSDTDYKTLTTFFVATAKSESGPGSYYGLLYSYDYRVIRLLETSCSIKDGVTTSSTWCNGEAGSEGLALYTASGATKPFVFVSRRPYSSYSWVYAQILGGAWIQDGDKAHNPDRDVNVFGQYDLHEFLTYSTELTDDQIREVAVCLMNKWGAPRQESSYTYEALPAINPVLTADATISTWSDVSLSSLAIDATGLDTPPCLSVSGLVDLGAVDISFIGINKLNGSWSPILMANPLLGESPKSVSGLDTKGKLKKSDNALYLKINRGLIITIY